MSLLDVFRDNSDIFKGDENRIDQDAFNKLIEEKGAEFAQGYLKAMQEFTTQFSNILYMPPGDHKGREYQTPATVYNKVVHLYEALFKFAEENGLQPDETKKAFSVHSRILGW